MVLFSNNDANFVFQFIYTQKEKKLNAMELYEVTTGQIPTLTVVYVPYIHTRLIHSFIHIHTINGVLLRVYACMIRL